MTAGLLLPILLSGSAFSGEEAVPVDPDRGRWSGIVIPLVGASTTDGFGFGAGGEVYQRLPEGTGFSQKFTFQLYTTVDFAYQSHFVQYEARGETSAFGRVGYQAWSSMLYAGEGGAEILVDHGDIEAGNRLRSPFAWASVSRPTGPVDLFVQLYARGNWLEIEEGNLLATREPEPFPLRGGFYGDVTVGFERERVDRWPLPTSGHRVGADLRAGLARERESGRVEPLAALHGEAVGWKALAGERLVLGGRFVAEQAVGERPFLEQTTLGGRRRDEIGFERALSGYGRTRTRGDGVVAAAVELRPFVARTKHPFWDIGLYASFYAEEGFLFSGWNAGPHLPSLGAGPILLWQGSTMLRPFVALGWCADAADEERRPKLQYGLSLMDPL